MVTIRLGKEKELCDTRKEEEEEEELEAREM